MRTKDEIRKDLDHRMSLHRSNAEARRRDPAAAANPAAILSELRRRAYIDCKRLEDEWREADRQEAKERERRYQEAERNVFGAVDTQTMDYARRNAPDHDGARRLLREVSRRGDERLGRALVMLGYEKGWGDVVDEVTERFPQVSADLDARERARPAQSLSDRLFGSHFPWPEEAQALSQRERDQIDAQLLNQGAGSR